MQEGDVNNILNHLIQICKDGQDGYTQAAESAISQEYTTTFHTFAKERAQAAADLEQEVVRMGGTPDKSGTPLAAVHRSWMGLKTALQSDDAGTRRNLILEECIRGEEHAREEYEKALQQGLPKPMSELLSRQLGEVNSSLKSLHEWQSTN